MNEFNGFPEDLNEWSEQNFKEATNLFSRTVERNIQEFIGKPKKNTVEKPNTNKEKVISKDDVLNLQIMLSQFNNVEDIIKNM